MMLRFIRVQAPLFFSFTAAVASAADLDLVTLRQTSGMYPNIMLTIDDSGSMLEDSIRTNLEAYTLRSYLKEGTSVYSYPYDWRLYHEQYNSMYYDTNKTYEPWYNQSNAPIADTFKEMNRYYKGVANSNFTYSLYTDTAGVQSYTSGRNTYFNYTQGANGVIDYWDDHIMITANDNGSLKLEKYTYSGTASNGQRFSVTVTSPNFKSAFKRSEVEEAQNIANWFKYHQTREKKLKVAVGQLIKKYPEFYYGLYFLNNSRNFKPVRAETDADITAFNHDLLDKVYANSSSGSTPMIGATASVGRYFHKGETIRGKKYNSPIEHACQANFNFVITDGAYSDYYSGHGYGDVDGDGDVRGIGDITRYYYTTDLAPDLPNIVPTYNTECPSIDAVNHQSLSFFYLTLGITGNLTPDAKNCWPVNNYGVSSLWGSYTSAIDQVWHAAYNSRGLFKSNINPDLIFDDIDRIFTTLQKEVVYNANTSLSSSLITGTNSVFYAKSNISTKKGYLMSQKIASGSQSSINWEAGDLLSENDDRHIFTMNTTTKKGVEITNLDQGQLLSGSQRTLLGSQAATLGASVHSHQLGPILNSDISYMGPNMYIDSKDISSNNKSPGLDSYSSYYQSRQKATPVVYVGSFDNMLHAFNAESGEELFAYLPSQLLKENMFSADLQDEGVGVDGHHFITDVYSKSKGWQSILIGGLRRGGQGYYGLNVTNPEAFSESDVLWEVNQTTNSSMGLSYARPAVGTFENGTTYVVLSNGLNANSSKPQLMILDALTGTLVKTFEASKGAADVSGGDVSGQAVSNSFAEPALVDSDRNGLIDTLYVGDWYGELYAFNVADTQASGWSSFGGTSGNSAAPIMSGSAVEYQPITTKPVVVMTQVTTDKGVLAANLVIYATGQNYTQDVPDHTEYLVAVAHDRDPQTALVEKSQLTERKIKVHGNTITADTADANPGSLGWFVKLDQTLTGFNEVRDLHIISGELHVVLDPKPSMKAESCELSENGLYSLVLNPRTGGATHNKVFMNEDGSRQTKDDEIVVGEMISSSEASLQLVIGEDGKVYNMTLHQGSVQLQERGALNSSDGRQSWRVLY